MTTIQDVAKHAGVGAATVSRVLSGNGYVKQTTRERVLRSIEELNYTPNEMARNLFHGKSGIVAVIIPELAHPFFSEMVSAIEVELCNLGYQTMVCNTFYEKNYELRYLEMLKRQRVDGIIAREWTESFSVPIPPWLRKCIRNCSGRSSDWTGALRIRFPWSPPIMWTEDGWQRRN